MDNWEEHNMELDGQPLQTADVMVIRVALNNFLFWLDETPESELGPIHGAYIVRTRNLLLKLSAHL